MKTKRDKFKAKLKAMKGKKGDKAEESDRDARAHALVDTLLEDESEDVAPYHSDDYVPDRRPNSTGHPLMQYGLDTPLLKIPVKALDKICAEYGFDSSQIPWNSTVKQFLGYLNNVHGYRNPPPRSFDYSVSPRTPGVDYY